MAGGPLSTEARTLSLAVRLLGAVSVGQPLRLAQKHCCSWKPYGSAGPPPAVQQPGVEEANRGASYPISTTSRWTGVVTWGPVGER